MRCPAQVCLSMTACLNLEQPGQGLCGMPVNLEVHVSGGILSWVGGKPTTRARGRLARMHCVRPCAALVPRIPRIEETRCSMVLWARQPSY